MRHCPLTWFVLVAFLAATPLVTNAYRRAKKVVDTIAGGRFVAIGGFLMAR